MLASKEAAPARAAVLREADAAVAIAADSATAAVNQMVNEELPRAIAIIDVHTKVIEQAIADAGAQVTRAAGEAAQSLLAAMSELRAQASIASGELRGSLSEFSAELLGAKAAIAADYQYQSTLAEVLANARTLAAQDATEAARIGDQQRDADWERKAKEVEEQVDALIKDAKDHREAWLVDLQRKLDLVGLIPGIGIIADLANTGISLYRGNWTDALMSGHQRAPLAGPRRDRGGEGQSDVPCDERGPA